MRHQATSHGRPGSRKRFTRARRALPWLVVMAVSACHTWKLESVAAGQAMRWETPVRVVLNTGEGYEFDSVRVTRDTLYGTSRRSTTDSSVAIPVSHVVRVEARRFSEGRTFGVFLAAVLSTIAIAAAAIALSFGSYGGG